MVNPPEPPVPNRLFALLGSSVPATSSAVPLPSVFCATIVLYNRLVPDDASNPPPVPLPPELL